MGIIILKITTMNKQIITVFVLILFCSCKKPSKELENNTPNRPNIIFIMADDHAVQAISSYGSKINKTPNIDRIARDGIRFANSFVTNSICAPSRAVLLTGTHSHINGQIDNVTVFDGNQETFPKLLQQAGYKTAMIGKWHLKSDPTGFDYWNILPGQGKYYNPDFIEMGNKHRVEGYVTDITTDLALNWLDSINRNKPFCLLLHHKAPHRNWLPSPEHLNSYNDTEIPLPETFFDSYATRELTAGNQEMTIAKDMYGAYDLKLKLSEEEKNTLFEESVKRYRSNLSPNQLEALDLAYKKENEALYKADLKGEDLAKWKYQRYIKDYLRCINSLDENIGRVLDYLKVNGLEKNTLIVYTSDQGFYLGEHGWFDKRFMYEESLRMPLLIKYPAAIKPNSVSDKLVQNLDFAPTFLDMAGVEIPSSMQGKSLKPLLENNSIDKWRDAIYYHYYEYPGWHMVKRHYGVRTKRYKLIHFYYDVDVWELYDLEKDPNELNNVYNNPQYSETQERLIIKLADLQEQYKDTDRGKEFLQKQNK